MSPIRCLISFSAGFNISSRLAGSRSSDFLFLRGKFLFTSNPPAAEVIEYNMAPRDSPFSNDPVEILRSKLPHALKYGTVEEITELLKPPGALEVGLDDYRVPT